MKKDAGYVLGLSLSGTPNGAETIMVLNSSAIFDFAGNATKVHLKKINTALLNVVFVLNLNGK